MDVRFLKLLVLLQALFLVGCSGSSNPPVPVSGKVLLNKKPVDGAVITFLSKDGGRSASARTEADGSFKLTTVNTGDGAPPGEYVVTIAKQESKVSTADVDVSNGKFGDAYGQMMGAAASGNMSKVMKDVLPAKYAKAAESGLIKTVVKGEPNDFTFEL